MSTPITKQSPIWLARQDPDAPGINPHYRRSIMYYRKLYQAWPDWCANHPYFKYLRDECRRRRARGEDVEIDHRVPISHPHVCGLHVPWNLMIISAIENRHKSNHYWEDMWNEQLFFDLPIALLHPQMSLSL